MNRLAKIIDTDLYSPRGITLNKIYKINIINNYNVIFFDDDNEKRNWSLGSCFLLIDNNITRVLYD